MPRHAAYIEAPDTMLLPVIPTDTSPVASLGSGALHAADRVAYGRRNAEYFEDRDQPELAEAARQEAKRQEEDTHTTLDMVRTRLAEDDKPAYLQSYVYGLAGDMFARDLEDGRTTHADILSWLADKQHGASNAQLFTFLRRQYNTVEKMQHDPELTRIVQETKERHMRRVHNWVAQGRLSRHALQTLGRVQDTEVVIGDVWDTYMLNGRIGYMSPLGNRLVISQHIDTPEYKKDLQQNVRETLPHELFHGQFDHDRLDLLPNHFYEFMAEHLTMASSGGHIDIASPLERTDQGEYESYRLLWSNILKGRAPQPGRGDNSLLRAAILAYSSPLGSEEWTNFHTQLDKEWGPNAFQRIDTVIQDQIRQGRQAGLSSDQASFQAARVMSSAIDKIRANAESAQRHGLHHTEVRPRPGRHARGIGATILGGRKRRATSSRSS
ncbi:MAG TPA: hypothetical protein VLF91_01455 [Candidatus Saccharimonadales bacterium]|nr:hypothetical protein [Candidatus Saccharimonadales bacterium]